ncbi:MAG: hypothetical protein SGARI_003028 [Bacillariaceae sp.]
MGKKSKNKTKKATSIHIPLVPPGSIPGQGESVRFRTHRIRFANIETSAPSFDELPPEKGTIMKLHSMDDAKEYNGKLVEFYNIDKDTGKYSVITYDKHAQPMKVRQYCCKRPDIKALQLRAELKRVAVSTLNEVMDKKNIDPTTTFDDEASRMVQILEVDPCNVIAHYCLSKIEQRKVDMDGNERNDKNYYKVMIQYIRRAIANFYAYEDIVSKELITIIKSEFLALLKSTGNNKMASILREKYFLEHNIRTPMQEVVDKVVLTRSLLSSVHDGWETTHLCRRYNEGFVELHQALRMIHSVETLTQDERNHLKSMTSELADAALQISNFYMLQSGIVQSIDDNGNLMHGSQDMKTCMEYVISIAYETVEICTLEDGTLS